MTYCHVEKILHMRNVKKIWRNDVHNLWCFVTFYVVLLQNLFCNLSCFIAKSVLYRFTRFFVKKIEPKIVRVEKNDKYEVSV